MGRDGHHTGSQPSQVHTVDATRVERPEVEHIGWLDAARWGSLARESSSLIDETEVSKYSGDSGRQTVKYAYTTT